MAPLGLLQTLAMEFAVMDVNLGGAKLHAFKTKDGVMFSMTEVGLQLFGENPTNFAKEVRNGRYKKTHIVDKCIVKRIADLNIKSESTTYGATLISPETLEEILVDKQRRELVPVLKIGLLKLVSQQAAAFISHGFYEDALPLALEAVKQGKALFYPTAILQLVPFYLLAIQANLGLGRVTQSADFIGMAAWLFLQTTSTNYEIQAELARCFGQLYILQERWDLAMQAFSEQTYYGALEHGVLDTRTSVGFYNLFKVLKALGKLDDSLACGDVVVETWLLTLKAVMLNIYESESKVYGRLDKNLTIKLKESGSQLESMHFKDVINMLRDIYLQRVEAFGEAHLNVAEVDIVFGLLFIYNKDSNTASKLLNRAHSLTLGNDEQMFEVVRRSLHLISSYDGVHINTNNNMGQDITIEVKTS